MLHKLSLCLLFVIMFGGLLNVYTNAQDTKSIEKNDYIRAKVTKVTNQDPTEESGIKQNLTVTLLDGIDKGKEVESTFERIGRISESEKIKVGDTVIVVQSSYKGVYNYFIVEKYRLDGVYFILGVFVLVTIVISRWKGFTSMIGLGVSVVILFTVVIPGISSGVDAMWICIFGAGLIAVSSMYLAHGINRRTSVALLSTIITIIIATIMAVWFVDITKLFGLGSEEAYYIQAIQFGKIDVRGLLLGGIIIGALGVLDDITVSQVSIVEELWDVDEKLSFFELFRRGLNIGKEHIASLINTLALAYVGASFPLLLSINQNQGKPIWVTLNSEMIVEEVVRTIVGSITLIIAVPVSTFLAAYFIKYPPKIFRNKKLEEFMKKLEPKNKVVHSHSHIHSHKH